MLLLASTACSMDDPSSSQPTAGTAASYEPHFYGIATLGNPAPNSRGVADAMKIWSKPMAENNLTVKFLNGDSTYRAYVRETAREWEKYAGVKFHFVADDQNALIRVGFDYIRGMMSSWAYTGTDHMQLYDRQTEATVHFARWNRASDAQRRGDVLRAFGQVLGLELEYRRPGFDPEWLDEKTVRTYWEDELAAFISWEELKKYVYDPLSQYDFAVSKTAAYDAQSIMTWPFYDTIANNLPIITSEKDYKTELSVDDKLFIARLYGPALELMPEKGEYLPLVAFDCAGSVKMKIGTSAGLVVIFDEEAKDFMRIEVPLGQRSEYATVEHHFTVQTNRRITIGELLPSGMETPATSTALISLDIGDLDDAGNVDIKPINRALSYVRFVGGKNFKPQIFDFSGFEALQELYLVRISGSKIIVDDCPNLEKLGTSRYIWIPDFIEQTVTPVAQMQPELEPEMPRTRSLPIIRWPDGSEIYPSLDFAHGSGLRAIDSPKIKYLSLDNTQLKQFDFSSMPNLEYVFLSSAPDYLVGGGSTANNGAYLADALQTLSDRTGKSTGVILLRCVGSEVNYGAETYKYEQVPLSYQNALSIESSLESKNWKVYWPSGCGIRTEPIPGTL